MSFAFVQKHFEVKKVFFSNREQNIFLHQATKSLNGNFEIFLQRPHKGAGIVAMDKNTYNNKLGTPVSKQEMFSLIDGKQTETVKSKINKTAKIYNSLDPTLHKTLKRVG